MARTNIINPTTGQRAYQVPGAALQPGWQWESGGSTPVTPTTSAPTPSISSVPMASPSSTQSLIDAYNKNGGKPLTTEQIGSAMGTPTVPTNTGPAYQPMQNAPTIPKSGTDDEILKAILDFKSSLNSSNEAVNKAQAEADAFDASRRTSYRSIEGQPIAMPFVTGQESAWEKTYGDQGIALQNKLANLQAKRTADISGGLSTIEMLQKERQYQQDIAKPIELSAGATLYDPATGKPLYTAPANSASGTADIQEYNLAKAQGFQGSLLDYKNAEKYVTASGKVITDPLSGRQMIINPVSNISGVGSGGVSNFGTSGGVIAGTGSGGGTAIPPEIQPAISNIGGLQFIDRGKLKDTQVPSAQRISAQTGIPLLTSEQANKVKEAQATYSSATGLIQQLQQNGQDLFTAKTIQEALVQGPQLAIQAQIKGTKANLYQSTMDSLLSLLTRAAGEKGALASMDVYRIKTGLPTFGFTGADTYESAQAKLNNFGDLFNNVFEGSLGAYIGSSVPSQGSGSTSNLGVSKGSSSDRDFVEKALSAQGIKYQSVIDKTPAGTIPVIQNSSGQVGYIPANEFNASLYTKL